MNRQLSSERQNAVIISAFCRLLYQKKKFYMFFFGLPLCLVFPQTMLHFWCEQCFRSLKCLQTSTVYQSKKNNSLCAITSGVLFVLTHMVRQLTYPISQWRFLTVVVLHTPLRRVTTWSRCKLLLLLLFTFPDDTDSLQKIAEYEFYCTRLLLDPTCCR